MSNKRTPLEAFRTISDENRLVSKFESEHERKDWLLVEASLKRLAQIEAAEMPELPAPCETGSYSSLYADRKRWMDYAQALSMQLLKVQANQAMQAEAFPTVRLCYQDMLAIVLAISSHGPLVPIELGPDREAHRFMGVLEEKGIRPR